MLATVPGGSATTTENALYAGRFRCEKTASPSTISARSHPPVEPDSPAKHATWVIAAGPETVTVDLAIDCSHWSPIAFQYSSSWVSKPFIAPSTR